MRILVITAVEAERDAALPGGSPVNGPPYPTLVSGDCFVAAVGAVGPVAAAVAASRMLTALDPVDLIVSAGLGGGFSGRAEIGDLVVANASVLADLGAATDDGFLDVATMGFAGGSPLVPISPDLVDGAINGTILTFSTMTGTEELAQARAEAFPGAVAEAMEGYGVAWAAVEHGVLWAEMRAISNRIGRRDRSTWDIPAALGALQRGVKALQ